MKKEIYILTIFILFISFLGGDFFDFHKVFVAQAAAIQATIKITVCGNSIKETGEQCDGTDLGGTSCTSLGYYGGTLGCSAACQRQTNSCIFTAPQVSATPTINYSNGGATTLTNTNSTAVVFNFPQNFYTENLKLEANSYSSSFFASDKPAPSGKNFAGKTYDFSFIIPSGAQEGTQISTLSAPVPITISYLDSDISGLDESTLVPYRWGANDTSWQLISGATIDTANNKITFSTTHFSSFAIFGSSPTVTPTPTATGSGGGGGGGGSYYVAPVTSVVFTGRAYPKSTVTLLKDAQVSATTIAGPDANFNVTLSGLSGGNYIFSVYSEDNKGTRSSLLTFPVNVTSGATTNVSGIFIAPTIAVDKSAVKRGDNVAIFGQSVPNSEVTISVNSEEEFFNKIKADAGGAYLYNFDTSPLETGQHFTKSKTALSGEISSFSQVIGFAVGTKNILAQLPIKAPAKGDSNNDSRVNLVDFSIVAYWYKRPSPPVSADLNSDGKVDLIDFSIMAFYWTG